ncbi:MAG: hypothetical protein M3014_08030 [Chloroflexota bacterium]|nr:hypothetical protein [Chloroflexota bacterium]
MSEVQIIRGAITRYAGEAGRQEAREHAWTRIKEFIQQEIEPGATDTGRTWRRDDLYDR